MNIAYAIFAHRDGPQVARLLSRVYDAQNVYHVHVDVRRPSVRRSVEAFASSAPAHNVHLLPSRRIIWGGWSLAQAQLSAMRSALREAQPWDYLINLSGQDYPLRSQAFIRKQLAQAPPGANFMEVLDFERARPAIAPRVRYCHIEVGSRLIRLRLPRRPLRGIKLYWGSNFGVFSRAFCRHLLDSPLAARCRRYLRLAKLPEEFLFQTVLMNSPEFAGTLVPRHQRMINWHEKGNPHPRIFAMDDLDALLRADAWFARKFDREIDAQVLDEIDRRLLQATVADEPEHALPAASDLPSTQLSPSR
jgi:hypothetical protein